MIELINAPHGSEKVTIDGEKVKEKMDLTTCIGLYQPYLRRSRYHERGAEIYLGIDNKVYCHDLERETYYIYNFLTHCWGATNNVNIEEKNYILAQVDSSYYINNFEFIFSSFFDVVKVINYNNNTLSYIDLIEKFYNEAANIETLSVKVYDSMIIMIITNTASSGPNGVTSTAYIGTILKPEVKSID